MANPTANDQRLSMVRVLHSFQISYADLAATSGTGAKTWTLGTLSVGAIIEYIRVKSSVAFSGGALSALVLRVGKSGGVTDFFVKDFDIMQAVYDGALVETFAPASGQLSAVTLAATLTPTGAACSVATAGVVNIDVLVTEVQTPATMPQYGSSTTKANVL